MKPDEEELKVCVASVEFDGRVVGVSVFGEPSIFTPEVLKQLAVAALRMPTEPT